MTTNIYSLSKVALEKQAGWLDNPQILPTALGLLGGGAIGYMTGKDANKLTGEKSTRLRNALIGSLLGGSTSGLGSYFLSKRLNDYHKKYDDAFAAYRNERSRLFKIDSQNWHKRRDREREKEMKRRREKEEREEREREELYRKRRKSIEKKASRPYLIDDDLSIIKSFSGYIPTLIGILGGGSTGYFFSKDKDKKNKLINTLLGATAGGSIGLLGSLLGARYESGSNRRDSYHNVLQWDPTEGLDDLNYKDE